MPSCYLCELPRVSPSRRCARFGSDDLVRYVGDVRLPTRRSIYFRWGMSSLLPETVLLFISSRDHVTVPPLSVPFPTMDAIQRAVQRRYFQLPRGRFRQLATQRCTDRPR